MMGRACSAAPSTTRSLRIHQSSCDKPGGTVRARSKRKRTGNKTIHERCGVYAVTCVSTIELGASLFQILVTQPTPYNTIAACIFMRWPATLHLTDGA